MHPKDLKIDDFTYDLPNDRIAYNPVEPRSSSKLLVYKNGEISTEVYSNIGQHLSDDCVLVFNDTKVIKSRMVFQRKTGAFIEVFGLEPHEDFVDYSLYFQRTGPVRWKCIVGNVSKWKEKQLEKQLIINGSEVTLYAELIEKLPDAYVVEFSWSSDEVTIGEIIEAAGATPLPPYIKRAAEKIDEETYQTVYSAHEGSVAAPTAGLHFTDKILEELKGKGVDTFFTTLHVGAGTFKPVKSDTMEGHVMHNEWMDVSLDLLEHLLDNLDKKIISVGTTSSRTIESIYWMGNKVCENPNIKIEDLAVSQWEPYEVKKEYEVKEAVSSLIEWMKLKKMTHLIVETGIIIAPGYKFKIVNGLITNFHQPQSTLLLLVSALLGDKWKEIYQYALDNEYRFLSYGDGSLLLP